jgi:hypothetical protein
MAQTQKWWSRGVVIHIKSRHGVDPYFDIPMPKSMNTRQKMWFFMRNATAATLPVFMGNCHVPQPKWGYRMAKKGLRK